jgi:hypothetical protein
MANPSWIVVDVEANLRDNPPWEMEIPEELIPDLAREICNRFDSTDIYDQLDTLACQLLRERGLSPSTDHLA